MYRPLRTFWTLAAAGGAIAVGLTTQNDAYIVITFLGGLIVPRMLGLAGPGRFQRAKGFGARSFGPGAALAGRRGGGGCGNDPWSEWHRQAHAATPASPPAAPTAPSA